MHDVDDPGVDGAAASHHRVRGVDQPPDLVGVGVCPVLQGPRRDRPLDRNDVLHAKNSIPAAGGGKRGPGRRQPLGSASSEGNAWRSSWTCRAVGGERTRRYVGDGSWTDETLGTILGAGLAEGRDLTLAIHSEVRPWRGTFADGYDLACRVAGGLRAIGVQPGDPVAFQLPNWLEAAATFWAVALLGAVPVPIVHFYGPKEVAFILEQSQAQVLVTADQFGHQDYLANLETFRPRLDALREVFVVGERGAADTRPFAQLTGADPIDGPATTDPSAPALIAYTSGTTPTRRASCTRIAPSGSRSSSWAPSRPRAGCPRWSAPRSGTASACSPRS